MHLYNTLTRSIENFVPITPDEVRMYTCGPTVYHFAHIGNLRGFLFYDVLKRALIKNGLRVNHVMNITDVGHLTDDADAGEDKMEKGSRREGKSAWDVARYYTDAFLSDMHALNIIPPTHQPKATDYIPQQISLIKTLESKGFTYTTSSGIAFDTSLFPTYSALSRLHPDELREGARVELDVEKKHPTDFYLWKFSALDEHRQMEWDSPWGVGFPGWHIECSAMAIELLGETIDIHCGGIDHIPVHHTNEIAQSESATGMRFSNFWLHNNFLTLGNGNKMAKSGDNFYTLRSIVDLGFEPMVYRYMVLTAHYRSELEFSIESLERSKRTLQNIRMYLRDHDDFVFNADVIHTDFHTQFMNAINDDLNTPEALSVLHLVLKSDLNVVDKISLILSFDEVFGLNLAEELGKSAYVTDFTIDVAGKSLADYLHERDMARKEKDWATSDSIRKFLMENGLKIEDSSESQLVKQIY